MKIILTYCNVVGTTALYLRNALKRAGVEILTVGENCDVNTGRNNPYPKISEIVKNEKFDLVFEVDSGGFELEWTPEINLSGIPRVWWGIDTHVALTHHINRASRYNLIFISQKQYIPLIQKSAPVVWLPHACDPEFHKGNRDAKKEYDVTFVGNWGPAHQRRILLLSTMQHNVKMNIKKNLWYKDVTSEYEKSHIVWNCSLNGDLNMRVFEMLASGAMLITDRVDENGGSTFFTDGCHLKFYRNENEMVEQVRFYLAHANQKNIIAASGQDEVLSKHTYDHRVQEYILPALNKLIEGTSNASV